MKRNLLVALCAALLCVAGCDRAPVDTASAPASTPSPAPVAESTPQPAPAPVTAVDEAGPNWSGYGKLRWGMTPEAMQAAWQPGALARPAGIGTDDTCHYLIPDSGTSDSAAQDVRLMVEEGRFVRVEFLTPASTAPGGGKVGWTAAQVRAAYPVGLEELAHKYEDGALYLRLRDTEGEGVLLFETDANGVVTRWRMGIAPQVDYVEGCA